jgi:hypothetical protein
MTERKRFKSTDELTPAEHLLTLQAKRRGAPVPKFEHGEYSKAKIQALRDAGLDQEADEHEAAATTPPGVSGQLSHIRRHAGTQAKAGRSPRAA